jgi:hypothetical protein
LTHVPFLPHGFSRGSGLGHRDDRGGGHVSYGLVSGPCYGRGVVVRTRSLFCVHCFNTTATSSQSDIPPEAAQFPFVDSLSYPPGLYLLYYRKSAE